MNNSLNNNESSDEKNESSRRIHPQALEAMKQEMKAKLAHFQERDYEWLWNYLDRRVKYLNNTYKRDKDKPDARLQRMAMVMINENIKIGEILDDHADKVLDLKYFDWIDQTSKRQLIFINLIILKRDERHRNNDRLNSPNLFNQIIENFDSFWGMGKKRKIGRLNDFKLDWDRKRVPDNLIKWIDPNNMLQLEWALDYLKKKDEWIKDLLVDSTKNHLYALILASLDKRSIEASTESTQLFMTKMSKTWSQKKFRDAGKTKNPYHLPLTKQAKKQMDELAERYSMKTNALLEMLISQEYEKEMLGENGKNKFK